MNSHDGEEVRKEVFLTAYNEWQKVVEIARHNKREREETREKERRREREICIQYSVLGTVLW